MKFSIESYLPAEPTVRIHFFTDYFRPEPPPPAHHIAERARMWARDGHDVTVITNHPNYPEGKLYPGHRNRIRRVECVDGYRVLRVWTHIADHTAKFGKMLDHASYLASATLNAMALPRPDVVIATSPHLFCGLAGAWYARARRRPLLLEVRDLWPDSVLPRASFAYRVFKRIERHIYRSASAVSVLTPAFEDHVMAEGARRAVTIVGGADLARFTPGDPPAGLRAELGLEGHFVVGYPGTLGTAHDLDLLIDAARCLRASKVRFLLIGGGPHMRDLERRAQAACPDMIRFVPTQTAESMPGWWRVMDAGLVLLKRTEAMRTVIPSKIFECMASAKPVVFVGPLGAGSSIVSETGGGLVVGEGGAQKFADELLALSMDPSRCADIARKAHDASGRFSRDRQASETLKVLQQIAEDRP